MAFDIAYDGDSDVLMRGFLEAMCDQIGFHALTERPTGEPPGWYVALTLRDEAGDPSVHLEGLAVAYEATEGRPEFLVVHPTDPATAELLPVEPRRIPPHQIAGIRVF